MIGSYHLVGYYSGCCPDGKEASQQQWPVGLVSPALSWYLEALPYSFF